MSPDNKLAQTAHSFWKKFSRTPQKNEGATSAAEHLEELRYRCVLGMIALDASISVAWRERVLPEWSEYLCLASSVLSDKEELAKYQALSKNSFSRAQWMASLRFVHNISEPAKFSPTFCDFACLVFLSAGSAVANPALVTTLTSLFRLQQIKNACFHTAREFSKEIGQEGLQLLMAVRKNFHLLSPALADYSSGVSSGQAAPKIAA